ncbi:TetR/AcrR family transcriptional regulator [Vallicoccus soli]|uniref:TetR family transcriptional regulator n=1 Tax=Vallicoccus soli TaxID=2339232 RepID=A0A3A3YVL8_9ACTN|nr:TetR family transcriptional regulator [Vallicoccus soli]RJK94274.1 TetR family transcriptional regulator [Vallicoccus soli]
MAGTAGSTPKGERRREAIAAAAADLALEEGFGAVTHRAVAARCGVPLGAMTYYFPDRPALALAALERGAALDVERARAAAAGPGDLAEVLVAVVTGDRPGDAPRLAALYERVLEVARTPALAAAAARWQDELLAAVAGALARHGAPLPPRTALALVDGSAVQALTDGRPDREHLVGLVRAGLAALTT